MLDRERERYARSGGVKAVALRGMTRLRHLPDPVICRRARTTDVFTECRAPVRWRYREKRSGGLRQICELPVKARLGQLIARDLIVAQVTGSNYLFAWPGRGIHRYVEAVRDGFAQAGPFAVTLDIRNCYASINISAVYALNLLPDELVRSTIDPRFLRFRFKNDRIHSPSYHVDTEADPGGLLQGGPASTALVVALLSDAFASIPATSMPLGYADEFVVFGRDRTSAEVAGGELARHLAESAMGPLQVRSACHDIGDGCDHVGCYFVKVTEQVECWIPDHKLSKLITAMNQRIRGSSFEDRARGASHFARVALGPYRWATDWQREHVFEEADQAFADSTQSNE